MRIYFESYLVGQLQLALLFPLIHFKKLVIKIIVLNNNKKFEIKEL
jgi:hypothetical protein